jgi:hypothetical protein
MLLSCRDDPARTPDPELMAFQTHFGRQVVGWATVWKNYRLPCAHDSEDERLGTRRRNDAHPICRAVEASVAKWDSSHGVASNGGYSGIFAHRNAHDGIDFIFLQDLVDPKFLVISPQSLNVFFVPAPLTIQFNSKSNKLRTWQAKQVRHSGKPIKPISRTRWTWQTCLV